jgi:hypothetical protein
MQQMSRSNVIDESLKFVTIEKISCMPPHVIPASLAARHGVDFVAPIREQRKDVPSDEASGPGHEQSSRGIGQSSGTCSGHRAMSGKARSRAEIQVGSIGQ